MSLRLILNLSFIKREIMILATDRHLESGVVSLREYFLKIESKLKQEYHVDELTDFFTNQPYSETKPYYIRRQLIPRDKIFKQIELVCKLSGKVSAIVWYLDLYINDIVYIFGKPYINEEPFNESTQITFRSNNGNIEVIKTRIDSWVSRTEAVKVNGVINEKAYASYIKKQLVNFIQFNLKN
jgi:hypothetical protein